MGEKLTIEISWMELTANSDACLRNLVQTRMEEAEAKPSLLDAVHDLTYANNGPVAVKLY